MRNCTEEAHFYGIWLLRRKKVNFKKQLPG
jgi:hypothetical protein